MRITIAYPDNGTQVCVDIEDQQALAHLYEKRLGQDIDGAVLGQQFAGYTFRIGGGHDKQGFSLMQGVLTPRRVRLLMKDGMSCFRARKDGERKRKTVRGCVLSDQVSALHLIVLEKGAQEIEGLTNISVPRRFGPKRAGKIRALFGLDKTADLTQHVIKREVKEGRFTQPKIQRLIDNKRLLRKKRDVEQRKAKKEASQERAKAYKAMLAKKE